LRASRFPKPPPCGPNRRAGGFAAIENDIPKPWADLAVT